MQLLAYILKEWDAFVATLENLVGWHKATGVVPNIPPAPSGLGSGTTTTPAPPTPNSVSSPVTLPAGIIGQPNGDYLVQVQAVEDARAKWVNDTTLNNAYWALHLPHWWAVDEVASCYPASDIVAQYVHAQCNKSMLTGALLGNNFNETSFHLWVVRPASAQTYTSPFDAAVVAGPNPLPSGLGFPGIKIADIPALLEKNRAWLNSRGPVTDLPWVSN